MYLLYKEYAAAPRVAVEAAAASAFEAGIGGQPRALYAAGEGRRIKGVDVAIKVLAKRHGLQHFSPGDHLLIDTTPIS